MIIKLLKRIQEVLRMKIEIELLEKEWFIQAPWGKICIVVWGNSLDPPVLVCHGMQDSAASFRPLMKLLPKNFYYVAMELPGNGKSDRFPPGIMISVFDLVYALEFVVSHFRWETFDYLSHSLSTFIGRHYNLCYPGKMRKVIELDPMSHDLGLSVPAQRFSEWYHKNYTAYFKKYKQYNGTKETAPQYSKEQIIKRIKRARGLTTETALATLERFIEPCGNGLWRFTYDQRFKMIQQPPLDAEQLKRLLTSVTTPTLTLAADGSHFLRKDKDTKFIFDENSYPSRNVRVLHIKGSHDVHILHPARVAPYISSFLLHGLKGLEAASKL